MDPGVVITVGVLWFLFNLFGKRKPGGTRTTQPPLRSRGGLPAGVPPSTGADPTQREGARLQDLLRELGRTLETAGGQRGSPPSGRRAPARGRASLESTPVVRSLEQEVRRPPRRAVDSDDEAEAVIARRRAEAEANSRPLGDADYHAFEARIRQEPADATATPAFPTRRLRDAVVWREILGPPVSLRDSLDS